MFSDFDRIPLRFTSMCKEQACTIGLVSGSGGNFDNFFDEPFIGNFYAVLF